MPASTLVALEALDAALTRLRRLWENPHVRERLMELLGAPVELSLVRTLRAIELAELPEPGVGDVAQILGVDGSTASRLVDQAVTAGAVTRTTSPHDRRRSVLCLSEEGEELLRRALRARTALLAEATGSWDADEVATLTALLDRFAAAVTRAEP